MESGRVDHFDATRRPPGLRRCCVGLGIHHFCEENIWTYDHESVERTSRQHGIISAPSCSFHFLPLVREIRRVVREELGELHAYQMLLSTFMPNWHPDDGSEFYARQRSTAAAREMTPFELVWLNWVFGDPTHASGSVTKAGSLPERSEDTWVVHMELDHGAGQLVVGHASPTDHRSGRAIGSNGLISFDIFAGTIDRELPTLGLVDHRYVGAQSDDLEQAYADEIATFIDTIHGDAVWPHSYRASSIATATLAAWETSASTGQRVIVDTGKQPGTVPANRSSRLGVDGRFGDLDNDGELAAELPLED